MRSRPTNPEKVFELRLIGARFEFKRQMILGFYIIDFVLPEQMICFEIDGENHKQRVKYDEARDRFINHSGFRMIRVRNEEAATYPLYFIHSLPAYPSSTFRSALAKANIEKALAKSGLSSVPTIGQKSLF